MVGLNSTTILLIALPVLSVHLLTVMLTKALQSYSRTRLEAYCDSRQTPELAEEVARFHQRTERGAEATAVLSGLILAAILGVGLDQWSSPPSVWLLLAAILGVGILGYVMAGVLGHVFAELIVLFLWPVTPPLRGVAWPFDRSMDGLEFLFEWLSGISKASPRPASLEVEVPSEGETDEEVEADLPETARAMLQNVVELTRVSVSEIMLPRPSIIWLASTVGPREALDCFRKTGRSRIPLFGETRDDIVGILLAKDLMSAMLESPVPETVNPARLARPAFCVPETRNAFDLLQDLRANRTQIAVLLDEYGGVTGLATIEDLLEQLVGPIDDEHDIPTPSDSVQTVGESAYEVDAGLPLEDFNARFHTQLPTEADYQTIGGLAFHLLGHLPEPGATFQIDGMKFTILDVRKHSIRRVRVEWQTASAPP